MFIILNKEEIKQVCGGDCNCTVSEEDHPGKRYLDIIQNVGYIIGGIANLRFVGFDMGIAAGLIFAGIAVARKSSSNPSNYDCKCNITSIEPIRNEHNRTKHK